MIFSDDHQSDDLQPKCIEPHRHFKSQKLQIGAGISRSDVVVSELVRKNQLLLDFSAPLLPGEETLEKQPIALGPNCYFSADHNEVYATVSGYPKLSLSPIKDKEYGILQVSIEPLFRISQDRMKAAIAIHPPVEHGKWLRNFSIHDLLEESGIVYGVDKGTLEKTQKIIAAGLREFNIITLAHGTKAQDGRDAYLEFEVKTGPIPGKILDDGTIDFRERLIFVPVTDGQIIAKKISPTHGKAGKSVLGERVEPQPGRDIAVNTLKDATYSHRTQKVTATNDGVLSVVGDTIIKVCSRQEIMGDIDYNTGHIQSRNSVVIHGSVQPGFRVSTDGDLEIRGTVMSTAVICRANVVIKSGVIGKNSTVASMGDADIYFIEQGEIDCGRNCIVRKEAYYSTIVAGNNILCMPNSKVVGGRLIASGNIVLGSVGAADAAPAFIAAGVDGKRLLQHHELQQKLLDLEEEMAKCLQKLQGPQRIIKSAKLEKEIDSTRIQLQRLNLIPGTPRLSKDIVSNESEVEGELVNQKIQIEIHGKIESGTILQIGNRQFTLNTTISNRIFRLNDTGTELTASPLRRRR